MDQPLVKREQCRRPEHYRDLVDASWPKKQRPKAEQDAVARHQIGSAPSGSCEDQELLLDEQVLGDKGLRATWAEKPSNSYQQVDEDYQELLHRVQTSALSHSEQDGQVADFSPV